MLIKHVGNSLKIKFWILGNKIVFSPTNIKNSIFNKYQKIKIWWHFKYVTNSGFAIFFLRGGGFINVSTNLIIGIINYRDTIQELSQNETKNNVTMEPEHIVINDGCVR